MTEGKWLIRKTTHGWGKVEHFVYVYKSKGSVFPEVVLPQLSYGILCSPYQNVSGLGPGTSRTKRCENCERKLAAKIAERLKGNPIVSVDYGSLEETVVTEWVIDEN